jgi:hypothetical protein
MLSGFGGEALVDLDRACGTSRTAIAPTAIAPTAIAIPISLDFPAKYL